jgi:S1-C subfamily serine protease
MRMGSGKCAALAVAASVVAAGCGSGSGSGSSAAEVNKAAQSSVVALGGRVGQDDFAGSGFVWDADRGLVVTNAHVTWGASELHARLSDGTEARGQIAAEAPCDDLAVIVLDPVPSQLEKSELTTSADVKPGDTVTAAGFTPGAGPGRKLVTTHGSVAVAGFPAAIDDRLPRLPALIEHQAPITPSESGGPLYDDGQHVVGMNSIVGHAEDAHGEPPFYAVTANRIKTRLAELKRSQSGRYVGWNDAHRCHRPIERLARQLHHGYKTTAMGGESGATMNEGGGGGAAPGGGHGHDSGMSP